MKIAVAPTIFISLGGSGHQVIHRFRSRLIQRAGTADLPFFRYLYIDTDSSPLAEIATELQGPARLWTATNLLDPSQDTLASAADPQRDQGRVRQALDLEAWWPAGQERLLVEGHPPQGTGGYRLLGRFSFLASQNVRALEAVLLQWCYELQSTTGSSQTLFQALNASTPLHIDPVRVEREVRLVVVASAAGGTGSGCLIDLGYLLRRLQKEHQWYDVLQFAHVMLARGGVATRNQERNTAALLTEIDHYANWDSVYSAPYLNLLNRDYSDRNPPFDLTFVVQDTQGSIPLGDSSSESLQELHGRIADYLLTQSIAVYSDEVNPAEVRLPLDPRTLFGEVGLNPPGVQTYGISCREWPAVWVHRWLHARQVRRLVARWVHPDYEVVQAAVRSTLHLLGVPWDADHRPRKPIDSDPLREELLRPVDGTDPLQLLEEWLVTVPDLPRHRTRSWTQRIWDRIRQAFVKPYPSVVDGKHLSEVLTACSEIVRMNADNLVSTETGYPRKVAEVLVDCCIRSHGGPGSAAAAAAQLRSAVSAEAAWISECIDEIGSMHSAAEIGRVQAWRIANDALLKTVLECKLTVCTRLADWFAELESRFDSFSAYLRDWANTFPLSQPDSVSATSSLILPQDVLSRLDDVTSRLEIGLSLLGEAWTDGAGKRQPGIVTQLRELIAAGLPKKDLAGRTTLFADSTAASYRDPDFSCLAPLGAQLFQRIAFSEASPYREEVLVLLQQEAFRQGRPIPSLTNEAPFLLAYNRGVPEYASLLFSGSPTCFAEIVRVDQGGYRLFDEAQKRGLVWLEAWSGIGHVRRVSVAEQVSPSISSHVVAFVSERCSIRSELIVGYGPERRRELLASGDVPALADSRIELPQDPVVVRRASMLLIVSATLDLWQLNGGALPWIRFVPLHPEPLADSGRLRAWQLPRSFRDALRALADQPELMAELEVEICARRESSPNRLAAAVRNAEEELVGLETLGSEGSLTVPFRLLLEVPYSAAVEALSDYKRLFGIPSPGEAHPYAALVDQGQVLPGTIGLLASVGGWYCLRCASYLGVMMPAPTKRCDSCNYPYSLITPESKEIESSVSNRAERPEALRSRALRALQEGRYEHARDLFGECLSLLRTEKDWTGVALTLAILARTAVAQKQPALATQILGFVEQFRTRMELPAPPPAVDEAEILEQVRDAARVILGEEGFEAARKRGADASLDQAVQQALLSAGPPLEMVRHFLQLAGTTVATETDGALRLIAARGNLQSRVPLRVSLCGNLTEAGLSELMRPLSGVTARAEQAGLVFYREALSPAIRTMIGAVRMESRFSVVPIPLAVVERAVVDGKSCAGELEHYASRYLTHRDLFDERNSIADTLTFFGRDAILQDLAARLECGEGVGLFGLRKSGKTSILNHLAYGIRHHAVLRCDLQEVSERFGADIFNRLLAQLHTLLRSRGYDQVPQWSPFASGTPAIQINAEFARRFETMASAVPRVGYEPRIICLLDEIERVMPAPHHAPSQAEEFNAVFGTLRAISQERRLLSLLVVDLYPDCTRVHRWPQVGAGTNPVYQFFTPVFLGPIEHSDCCEMLEQIGGLMGRRFCPEVLETIHRESGGHPYLARQIASLLCKKIPFSESPTVTYALSRAPLASAIRHSLELSDHCRHVWEDLEHRNAAVEVAVLRTLAASGAAPGWIEEATLRKKLAGFGTVAAWDGALNWLCSVGLVVRETGETGDRYQLRAELFQRWLRRNMNAEEQREWRVE